MAGYVAGFHERASIMDIPDLKETAQEYRRKAQLYRSDSEFERDGSRRAALIVLAETMDRLAGAYEASLLRISDRYPTR